MSITKDQIDQKVEKNQISGLGDFGETNTLVSLCMNCENPSGETRMMQITIPNFRECLVSSFYCEKCGFTQKGMEFSGILSDQGVKICLHITDPSDYDREIIKSEFGTLSIPELELEIPPSLGISWLRPLEGVISNVVVDLERDQPVRKIMDVDTYNKIEEYIKKLNSYITNRTVDINLILDDPSGNSFISNPNYPNKDKNSVYTYYNRTKEQLVSMGYNPENYIEQDKTEVKEIKDDKVKDDKVSNSSTSNTNMFYDFSLPFNVDSNYNVDSHVEFLKVDCPNCFKESDCRFMTVKTPFADELIIMCQLCESCNYRTTEIKTGGSIKDKGKIITILVDSDDYLKLDIFKSNICKIKIPELDFEYESYLSESSHITTVQGLIQILIELFTKKLAVYTDSDDECSYGKFLKKLDMCYDGTMPFTLELDDPLGYSFIWKENLEKCPNVQITEYERTPEMDEEYGIAGLKQFDKELENNNDEHDQKEKQGEDVD